VRQLSEAEQTECMLTENDDRNPLKPTELAADYMRMVSLGCSVRRLAAKVGRSAKHVSSHMALLELPDHAQREVDEGTLSLSAAAVLLKLKDDPALIEELLALPAWRRHDLEGVAERRIAERAQEQAYAEAVAAEEAKGTRVIESVRARNARPLRELGFTEEAHRSEPCHAVAVERRWRDVEALPACTDPPATQRRAGPRIAPSCRWRRRRWRGARRKTPSAGPSASEW
jgi:hypothetical protein